MYNYTGSETRSEIANGLTYGPVKVNIDNGDVSLASDWFDICNLSSLPEGSYVAIFIDNSSATQASYDALVTKLTAKNITVITVDDFNQDWITPFIINDLSGGLS